MRTIAAGIFLVVLCGLLPAGAAAEVGVTLRLDRTEATLADTVRMEVRVSGSRSSDAEPVLHGLEAFRVNRGGRSSRVEIVNGRVNAGVSYTYFLQPRKTGTFDIGPVEIEVDGRPLKSNRAPLTVTEAASASDPDGEPVFMEAAISSPEFYVEEQALYTLKLYRRIPVDDLTLNLPEMDHVTIRQLGRPRSYATTIAGKTYQVLEIRCVLTASKPGEFVLEPSRMRMTARGQDRRSGFRDLFDDPFFKDPFSAFAPGRPLSVATRPLALTVRPLPEEGRPAGFSGLVGDFRMESGLEPASLKTGESATLTLRITGRGNVKRIPDIDLPDLPFARTYSDQPVLATEQDERGFGGTKTMKWALVPEKAGRFETPALNLSFFNPETEQYTTLSAPARPLSVLPGESPQTDQEDSPVPPGTGKAAPQGSVQQEIRQIGQDILPVHTTAGDLSAPHRNLSPGWLFGLALAAPLSVYLMLSAGLKLKRHTPERAAVNRSRKAFKTLKSTVDPGGRTGPPDSARLIEAFTAYLNDRFGLAVGTLTADDARNLLLAEGAGPETTEAATALIRRIEDAIYAGTGTSFDAADAADTMVRLAAAMEKEIP